MRTLALTIAAALWLLPGSAGAQKRTIVIDAGHGGTDPGGTGNGHQEKHIVLDVAKKFQALLDADTLDPSGGGEWTVRMTRESDTFVSLAARASYANAQGADRFISIHSNAFGDPSANGIETFSYQNGTQGAALRNLIQEEMVRAWGLRDRGNKTANFYVLRETAMPAVLHELAFITNTTDVQKLASAEERQKAAVAHLFGLQRHYGLAPHVPGAAAAPGEIAGWVSGPEGPVAGARVSLGGDAQTETDGDGAFSLPEISAGTHTLLVEAESYRRAEVEVAVEAGERAEIEVVLVPRARDGEDDDDDEIPGGDDDDGSSPESGCSAAQESPSPLAVVLLFVALALRARRRPAAR